MRAALLGISAFFFALCLAHAGFRLSGDRSAENEVLFIQFHNVPLLLFGPVPFLLSEETKNAPSAIEVAFHTSGYRYAYYISWKPDYIVEERLTRQEGKKKEFVLQEYY